eukprot:m.144943 g.144943  ORF g.144943 m.144943 type:complete len:616 (+) comp30403_c0_seq1:309-2156(+)
MMRWTFSSASDGCKHTTTYKERSSGKTLKSALANVCKAYRFIAKRQDESTLRCMECVADLETFGDRQFLCLQCVFIGCQSHIIAHAESANTHNLFIDIASGHVFCTKCKDYVYDPEFERIAMSERRSTESSTPSNGVVTPWCPKNVRDRGILEKHFETSGLVSSALAAGLGLRGLCNLGNTCYTSCIIQALVHNPLLRNFFLGGMHKKSIRCKSRNKHNLTPTTGYQPNDKIEARWKAEPRWYPGTIVKMNADETAVVLYDDGDTEYAVTPKHIRSLVVKSDLPPAVAGDSCLGCAMGNIFFEMYSGDKSQMAPYKLLFAVWQHSKHLAGYSQQDAHEFFMALLDGLNIHLGAKPTSSPIVDTSAKPDTTRDSIIQRIFTGALQSDVTCTSCHAISTTIDSFWDISLDVRPIAHMPTPQKTGDNQFDFLNSSLDMHGAPNLLGDTCRDDATNTLHDCLCRYTRTEQLSTMIHCTKCGDRRPATKRMSMSKLPMVVVFHLKRFEHGKEASKITTPVKFPEQLDMKPYLAESIATSNGEVDASTEIDGPFSYSLYCVVNHHGTLANGHYTNYIRQASPGGQWFLCDDETIQMVSITDVLASEGYMLFYIKRQLEYQD